MRALRIIFFSLLVIGIIVSSYYGYNYLQKVKTPPSIAVKAIPTNAALIIRSTNADETWKKLNRSSLIWNELTQTPYLKNIHAAASIIDSALQTIDKDRTLLKDKPVYLSVHRIGSSNFGFLFSYALSHQLEPNRIKAFIRDVTKRPLNELKVYDNAPIETIDYGDNKLLYISVHKKVLVMSFHQIILEQSIRQLNSEKGLLEHKDFNKLHNVAGTKPEASVFVNYKTFSEFADQYRSEEYLDTKINDIGSWSLFDINTKPNELHLSGFTTANDSANHYLSVFKGQNPVDLEAMKVMPHNTVQFLVYGSNNFGTFQSRYKNYLNIKERLQSRTKELSKIDTKYNVNTENSLTNWVTDEHAAFYTIHPDNSYHAYAAFKSDDIKRAMEILELYAEGVISDINEEKEDVSNEHRGHKIIEIHQKNLLINVWGPSYKDISNNFITTLGDYVVFANSKEDIAEAIDAYENERTLSTDEYYLDFFEDNLNSQANIYYYCSLPLAKEHIAKKGNSLLKAVIELNDTVINKFQAVAIQYSFKEGLSYSNAFLKHNPRTKKILGTIWETELDTSFNSHPIPVVNHYTKAKELFVQDDANTIYLIDGTGKILWKKNIEGKIISKVYQVDALKNNKLQLLFSTKNQIHLLDRNGHAVNEFPVTLPEDALNGIALFDYDENKNYRIIVQCGDKKLYNYSIDGNLIKGWEKPNISGPLSAELQHCIINGKDYIIAIDDKGKVRAYDRRGNARLTLKKEVGPTSRFLYLKKGKSLDATFMLFYDSTESKLHRHYLSDRIEDISIDKEGEVKAFIRTKNDLKYITWHNNKLTAYKTDGSESFSKEMTLEGSPLVRTFNIGNKDIVIGISSGPSNSLYAFSSDGRILKPSPLKGEAYFCINELYNDHILYVICKGTGNRLFAYQIE